MTTTEDLSTHEKRQLFGAYQTNKAVRLKIDALMHKCQIIECNLGIDSTDEERKIANEINTSLPNNKNLRIIDATNTVKEESLMFASEADK